MVEIEEEQINHCQIEVLKNKQEFSKQTVKGWDYFQNPLNNAFIIASKNKGKSTIIYNIVKNCIDKRTTLIIFSGSIGKDHVYDNILKYCKEKEIVVKTYSSFIENGINVLDRLLTKLQVDANTKEEKEGEGNKPIEHKCLFDDNGNKIRPKRTKKKIVPDIMICYDDLGNQLRHKIIARCCKIHRHFSIFN